MTNPTTKQTDKKKKLPPINNDSPAGLVRDATDLIEKMHSSDIELVIFNAIRRLRIALYQETMEQFRMITSPETAKVIRQIITMEPEKPSILQFHIPDDTYVVPDMSKNYVGENYEK